MAIDPNLLPALGNLGHAYLWLGRQQEALDAYRRMTAAHDRYRGDEQYDPRISALNRANSERYAALILRDPLALRRAAAQIDSLSGGTSFAELSDPTGSRTRCYHTTLTGRLGCRGQTSMLGYRLAREQDATRMAMLLSAARGNGQATIAAVKQFAALAYQTEGDGDRNVDYYALSEAVVMLARVGSPQNAAWLAGRLPANCDECVRAKGWAALSAGDRSAARRWFVEAVRLGPRLPAAYVDLGRLDALEGKPTAALKHLREAARLSPNWADPARYEGDVLARSGRLEQARAAYDRAVRAAPQWGTLRLNQGRVLAMLGDRSGASGAYTVAGHALAAPSDRAGLAQARDALHR